MYVVLGLLLLVMMMVAFLVCVSAFVEYQLSDDHCSDLDSLTLKELALDNDAVVDIQHCGNKVQVLQVLDNVKKMLIVVVDNSNSHTALVVSSSLVVALHGYIAVVEQQQEDSCSNRKT